MKYRKKPVVIEAIRCVDAVEVLRPDADHLPRWLVDAYTSGDVEFTGRGAEIKTLEGTMLATASDWIICGVVGELYSCKPDIFAATYDPA